MPTYESWKPCGRIITGTRCENVADLECTEPGCQHEDHPRFVCEGCEEAIRIESEKPFTCEVCGHRVRPNLGPHEHGIPILWKVPPV